MTIHESILEQLKLGISKQKKMVNITRQDAADFLNEAITLYTIDQYIKTLDGFACIDPLDLSALNGSWSQLIQNAKMEKPPIILNSNATLSDTNLK